MARRYSISGEDTNTAATSILGVTSTSAIRPKIFYAHVGSDATPADNAGQYDFQRYTAAGTSTAVTPQALDSGDPAATATAGKAHSAEPTYTSNAVLLTLYANQRAGAQWYAAPGGEMTLPATAANGVGIVVTTIGGSAVNTGAVMHYEE